jgi:para-nitrobenzyl esterase
VRHTPESADNVMHRVLTEAGLTPQQGGQLRDMPAEVLLDLQQRATPRAADVFYRPVADGDLIPEDPFAAVAQGASAGIPLVCGTNLEEVKFQRAIDPAGDTLDEAGLLRRCQRIWADKADVLVNTYRDERHARGEDTSASELWFAIASDHRFRVPAMRQAELHGAHTAQTYAYLFTWRSPLGGGRLGAAHGVELGFVFGQMNDPRLGEPTEQVERLSAHMMDRWIAFARNGQPDVEAPPAWPRYTPDRATMIFGDLLRLEDAPLEAERAVWASYAFDGQTARP